MLRGTAGQGTVAAFYNNGGLRTEYLIPEDEDIRQITINDIYSMAPFANQILIYDITGPELAKQLSGGLKKTNVGDQMSGLTFTYTVVGDGDTTQKNKEYEILSITLDDGTEVDLKDNKTLYRVCTVDYCASVPGSVFQDKKPVVPVADAPVDVDLYIDVLRKEREENDGYIYVDTGERGIEVAPEDAAGELKKTA
jgi:2',3'-cyclic-nucleotide 2'-phosphodiesterase (5'-nucleotidase family)